MVAFRISKSRAYCHTRNLYPDLFAAVCRTIASESASRTRPACLELLNTGINCRNLIKKRCQSVTTEITARPSSKIYHCCTGIGLRPSICRYSNCWTRVLSRNSCYRTSSPIGSGIWVFRPEPLTRLHTSSSSASFHRPRL
jgi:hypothetical protein